MGISKQEYTEWQESQFNCPDCGSEFHSDEDLLKEDGVLYCPDCHYYFGKGERDERSKIRIV